MSYDYTNITKGGVYEVLDPNGNVIDKMYMIVSDDQYNAMSSFVLVVSIDTPIEERGMYHVPFNFINRNGSIPMHICAERLFNISKKRIGRYKFTMNKEIQREVLRKIMLVITGETLFTMNEAIVELHNIEMNRRVEAMTSMTISKPSYTDVQESSMDMELDEDDDENLTAEDQQRLFAMKMKGVKVIYEDPLPEPIQEPEEPDVSEEIVEEEPETVKEVKKKTPTKSGKRRGRPPKKKSKRGGDMGHHGGSSPDPKYTHVYNNKEDFLLDYYSMTKSEVAKKWNLESDKVVANRAFACRRMLIREGFDMSYFDQLSQEHTNEMRKSNNKKKAIIPTV